MDDGADDFPYQVVSVDLIRFKDKFPKLAPSPANAIRDNEGFILFRKYCVKCHGIDGEGGQKGPDLKKSDAFTRLSNEQLRRWVLDPQKSKPGTAMPPFAPHLPEREHKLDQILSYLKGKRSE